MTEDKAVCETPIQVANPTGIVIGGLTLDAIRTIIVDSEDRCIRGLFFDFAIRLMGSNSKSLMVSENLNDKSQKYWMSVLRREQ
jgi:hypothetical protein